MIERRSLLALFGLAPFVPLNWLPTEPKPAPPSIPLITYRTTGKWGEGAHRELYASDVDRNFYALAQRLEVLEAERAELARLS